MGFMDKFFKKKDKEKEKQKSGEEENKLEDGNPAEEGGKQEGEAAGVDAVAVPTDGDSPPAVGGETTDATVNSVAPTPTHDDDVPLPQDASDVVGTDAAGPPAAAAGSGTPSDHQLPGGSPPAAGPMGGGALGQAQHNNSNQHHQQGPPPQQQHGQFIGPPGSHPPHMAGPPGGGRGGGPMMVQTGRGGMPMGGGPPGPPGGRSASGGSMYRSGSQGSTASHGPQRPPGNGPPPTNGGPGPGNYFPQNSQNHGVGHPGGPPSGFVPRGGMAMPGMHRGGGGGHQPPPSPRDNNSMNGSHSGPPIAHGQGQAYPSRGGGGHMMPPGQRPPPPPHMMHGQPHPGQQTHPGQPQQHPSPRGTPGQQHLEVQNSHPQGHLPSHHQQHQSAPGSPATLVTQSSGEQIPSHLPSPANDEHHQPQQQQVHEQPPADGVPSAEAPPTTAISLTPPADADATEHHQQGSPEQQHHEQTPTAEEEGNDALHQPTIENEDHQGYVAATEETTETAAIFVVPTETVTPEVPVSNENTEAMKSPVDDDDGPSFDTASEASIDFVAEEEDPVASVHSTPKEAGLARPSSPPSSPGKKKTVVEHSSNSHQHDEEGKKVERQSSTTSSTHNGQSAGGGKLKRESSTTASSTSVSGTNQRFARSSSSKYRGDASVASSAAKQRPSSQPTTPAVETSVQFVDEHDEERGGGGSRLKMEQVKPEATAKKVFLQRFAKILNQHQYYGRIEKFRNLVFLRPRGGTKQQRVQNRSLDSTVLLAVPSTIDVSADQLDLNHTIFYPQVLLETESAVPYRGGKQSTGQDSGVDADRQVVTHFLLFEGATGRMMFAQSELEGRRKLVQGDSCFVTDQSGLLMRSPNQLLPVAELDVVWTPAAKIENAACPKHKIPLQLYNPDRKELCCALCYANSPFHQHLVVLDDVLSAEKNGGRSMLKVLEERRDYIGDCVRQGVHIHSQISTAADKKREAVNAQLDLVVAAVNAKRKQLLEEITMEEKDSQSKLTGELLAAQEHSRHAVAAIETLKSSAASPTLLELSTVASARSSFDRIEVPRAQADPLSNMTVSVEGLVEKVQQVTLRRSSGDNHSFTSQSFADHTTDPFRHGSPNRSRQPLTSASMMGRANSSRAVGNRSQSRHQSPPRRQPLGCTSRSCSLSPQRRGGEGRSQHHDNESYMRGQTDKRSEILLGDSRSFNNDNKSLMLSHTTNTAQAPPLCISASNGSALSHMVDGTCVFNCPLASLITPRKAVEWRLRIDDHGDWVGVGVAVGTDLESLATGTSMDTKHLWIAPIHFPRILRLRVNTGPNGVAKLTVHDNHGKQLDDGRIPHWSIFKSSFPQVSFGKVKGKVTMLEAPKQTSQTSARAR